MKKIIFVFMAALALTSCARGYIIEYTILNDSGIPITLNLYGNNDKIIDIGIDMEFLYMGGWSNGITSLPFEEYKKIVLTFNAGDAVRYMTFEKYGERDELFDRHKYEGDWVVPDKKYKAVYRITPEMYESAEPIEP